MRVLVLIIAASMPGQRKGNKVGKACGSTTETAHDRGVRNDRK